MPPSAPSGNSSSGKRSARLASDESKLNVTLPLGAWYWRVNAVSDKGLQGNFTTARSFVVIQSKVKIGEAAFTAGLFAWLMLWRVLPPRLRTSLAGLLLLAAAATLATVVFEAAWYGLVNKIDPVRVLAANIDPDLAPRPALKVLIASVAVIVLVAARRSVKTWRGRHPAPALAPTTR